MPKTVQSGGIYLVRDERIQLIPEEERQLHAERRRFVVLSGLTPNVDPEWPFVLGCPLSSSTRRKTAYDLQLNQGQAGVTKKCWVRVPALQPLMKDHLEDLTGTLDERLLPQLQTRVLQYMGLV